MNVLRRYPSGRLHLHHFSSFPVIDMGTGKM